MPRPASICRDCPPASRTRGARGSTTIRARRSPPITRDLLTRLAAARDKLPPLYRTTAADPFVAALEEPRRRRSSPELLAADPQRERTAGLMLDIAQAILQNGEGYEAKATDAFQEVISDLYDGFLSAADRQGVKEPDYEKIAPLVKWGNPDSGPYTWPADATRSFGLDVAIVNLPPANARRGLCAYAALGHESGGHDILHADEGLLRELGQRVRAALVAAKLPADLATYWSSRIDETASDVLGVLNLGPAAAVGLIAYFRGIRAAFGGGPALCERRRRGRPASGRHRARLARRRGGARCWNSPVPRPGPTRSRARRTRTRRRSASPDAG